LFQADSDGLPELAVPEEELLKRDSELVACEVECLRAGRPVLFVALEIPGLDEFLESSEEEF
jgi:hypothetical protein